jgi:hypothetical protein
MPTALLERERRRASTLVLYVPRMDWAAVTAGVKTQWRAAGRGAHKYDEMALPRPVVLHSQSAFHREPDVHLAVLENVYREPLGAITAEGLAAEGMASLADFRVYWKERHKGSIGFKPLTIVNVYCVRPWCDGDRERFGDVLLEHLYGRWL